MTSYLVFRVPSNFDHVADKFLVVRVAQATPKWLHPATLDRIQMKVDGIPVGATTMNQTQESTAEFNLTLACLRILRPKRQVTVRVYNVKVKG